MYTHLQSLRAMHLSTRSEGTNSLLEKLQPWFMTRFLMPGTTVEGCLACALGLLFNDSDAIHALAVFTKSWYKKGVGYAQLVEEGWLGWVGEDTRGNQDVRRDRQKARRETRVSDREWKEGGDGGVEFRDIFWNNVPAVPEVEDIPIGPPARPERVKGQTLWSTRDPAMQRMSAQRFASINRIREEEEKRLSGLTLRPDSTKPPTIPEGSKRGEQAGSPPLSPLSRRPKAEVSPQMRRSKTDAKVRNSLAPLSRIGKPIPPRTSYAIKPSAVPAPLQVNNNAVNQPTLKRAHSTHTIPDQRTKQNPFKDQIFKNPNPFEDKPHERWDESDEESVVGPSVINGGDQYSDSDYGDEEDDDDTQQRYLDEHDRLMKMVRGGKEEEGRSKRPRTRDYLNTLPPRE
ncbi:MAG: hypothetical protein Q9170_002741 [Blastenia crenularia]